MRFVEMLADTHFHLAVMYPVSFGAIKTKMKVLVLMLGSMLGMVLPQHCY